MTYSLDLDRAQETSASRGVAGQGTRSLGEFVAASVDAARVGEAPFYHLVLDRVFPDGDYAAMLRAVRARKIPTVVCTVYDAIPGLEREAVTALSAFNDVIVRAAAAAGVPVIDLRAVCDAAADYSAVSPIEPSRAGGDKIAGAIAGVVARHDFTRGACVVYTR